MRNGSLPSSDAPAMGAEPQHHGRYVLRRVFRRVVCIRCGQSRREMRTFGVPHDDEFGRRRPRREIRRELRTLKAGWTPPLVCGRCSHPGRTTAK